MKNLTLILGVTVTIIFLIILDPILILLLLIANLLIVAIKGSFQLRFSLFKPSFLRKTNLNRESFISIHIATHNEPPDILLKTLRSISRIKYNNYEVIVVDNNTKDDAVWKPIQAYCKKVGKKFRFFHVDNLVGFKAGALNFAKEHINLKAEFIAIIDADYEIASNFMNEVSRYFTNTNIAFVQFPQAYKNIDKSNIGLELEYRHFFQTYMNMANYYKCVTSTGTLSIFRVDILKKIGYFKLNYITEDAEIGLRLNQQGYQGLYVPKVIGRGLIPFDISAYKKQKLRWALGNIQILQHSILNVITDKNLNMRQKIGLLAQLSAWMNFTMLPILTIIAAAMVRLIPDSNMFFFRPILIISGFTLIVFLLLKIASFYSVFHGKYSIFVVLKAFLVHIGTGSIYSLTAFRLFIKSTYIFERTNKFILPETTFAVLHNVLFELAIGIFSLALCIYHLLAQRFMMAFILLIVSVIYFAVIYVLKELKPTKRLSAKLFD